ncbi:hypothetical protein GNI_186410 [Gregarina niphandrodes]|uniref:Uncharacterized protein n=1 Tax=Gregarina niphandrodes TaxID=110365 RepID=A0A023AWN6_GRENI|nr:hypothetical protein GNI_186410 [Gregarina niphandrodes]EZG43129.1 hypothetical protein GNI_186410 [Gregarina niphandrodes]|eukprot:XP_011133615.1 hypothetical protein GNI_186410 [Gregarina niphandrodes]
MRLAAVVVIASADFMDGTCVSGVDPMGLEQSCLGRCHIYYEGDYGACNHKVETWEMDGPCGDSVERPCLSTFNAGWEVNKENCGNCYKVDMKYDDGTVKSTYIRTLDTNGSETKFEMGQTAWLNLCPYVCAGTGVCAYKPEQCQYGIIAGDKTISCAVQNAPITFKRVDCNGGTATTTKATATTRTTTARKTKATTTPKTKAATTGKTKATTTGKTKATTTGKTKATTTPNTTTNKATTAAGNGSVVSQCVQQITATQDCWTSICQGFCDMYGPGGSLSRWCGGDVSTVEELLKCINSQQSFCV